MLPVALKARATRGVLWAFALAACASPQDHAAAPAETEPAASMSMGQTPQSAPAMAQSERKLASTPSAGQAQRSAAAGTSGSALMTSSGSGGAGAAQAPAAGSGGSAGTGTAPAAGASGQATAGTMAQSSGPLTLELVDGEDLGDGFFAFPESARPPMNQSPPFRWHGGPAATKSYALVFRDVTNAMPPVKWVLWNVPPARTEVPANVSGTSAMPNEVPGASQLGSLGNQGYAGPCCVGNKYEWIVYALDVAELPDTQGMSTAQLNMSVIPMHTLEKSKALMLRIK